MKTSGSSQSGPTTIKSNLGHTEMQLKGYARAQEPGLPEPIFMHFQHDMMNLIGVLCGFRLIMVSLYVFYMVLYGFVCVGYDLIGEAQVVHGDQRRRHHLDSGVSRAMRCLGGDEII